MYAFESRVRYSEIDHNETITLPAIINYFQDCSTFHSEEIGYGVNRLKEEKRAWILSYWQIVVDRYPRMGEKIKICTWPTGFKGFLGDRNFQILDEEGKRVAYAYSLWVYMDMEKGRFAKPGKEEREAYGVEPSLEMDYRPRKIVLPEEFTELESFPVRRYHIDTNEHVNNCQYVQMAMEMLKKDIKIRQVRVEYKKSAVYGDVIVPKLAKEEERTVIELCSTKGEVFAVVEIEHVAV